MLPFYVIYHPFLKFMDILLEIGNFLFYYLHFPGPSISAAKLLIFIHEIVKVLHILNMALPLLHPCQLTERIRLHLVVHGELRRLHFLECVADDRDEEVQVHHVYQEGEADEENPLDVVQSNLLRIIAKHDHIKLEETILKYVVQVCKIFISAEFLRHQMNASQGREQDELGNQDDRERNHIDQTVLQELD